MEGKRAASQGEDFATIRHMTLNLGPERVAALIKGNVERPSDLDGVVYISLDRADWMTELARELQAVGYEIDWNRVMGPS